MSYNGCTEPGHLLLSAPERALCWIGLVGRHDPCLLCGANSVATARKGKPISLSTVQRHQYHYFMRICIRCDVLEKDDNVVGRTRDQRRVCGGVGQCKGLSLWHANVRVSYNRALHCVSKCTTTSSEAGGGCGFDAGCAC
jgi:hypothetical protein